MFLKSHRVKFSDHNQWESQKLKTFGTLKFALANKLQQAAWRMDTNADSDMYTNRLKNKLSAIRRALNRVRLCVQEEGGLFWHSWQTHSNIITLFEAIRKLPFPNLHASSCPTLLLHSHFQSPIASYVYWTVHNLDSWIKRDQLDITCFIISLFNTQHVSDVNTSILRCLRLICWVISWVVLLWFDVCWCYVVVWLWWCGIRMQALLYYFII